MALTLSSKLLLLAALVVAYFAGLGAAESFKDKKPLVIHGGLNYNDLVDPKYTPHGDMFAHFDCSACLVVARVLGERMNASLRENAGSFVVSHRQDTLGKDARRRDYRDSELRTIEVLETLCDSENYERFAFRFNNKTKSRAYHLVTDTDMMEASRPPLREDTQYPQGPPFSINATGAMLPMAIFYNANEHRHLRHLVRGAGQHFCVHAMDDFDEEMEIIVRNATTLEEVEYYLCGLYRGAVSSLTTNMPPTPPSGNRSEVVQEIRSTEGETCRKLFPAMEKPLIPVCAPVDKVARAAHMDNLRWRFFDNKNRTQNSTLLTEREQELSEEYQHEVDTDVEF